ncbi:glycolipid transfer protein-like [Watersipora subatra]|uniref:glycolipid transfer protein-like n=1 Tax=Watersipora subatra TaxID=2589382 RepID=UPI00355C073E
MVTKSTCARIVAATSSLVLLTLCLYHIPGGRRDPDKNFEIGKRHHDVVPVHGTDVTYEVIDVKQTQDGTPIHRKVEKLEVETENVERSTTIKMRVASCSKEGIHNFFTDMKHSFTDMLGPLDRPTKTKEFLDCCRDLATIFDRLGKALSPMEHELTKNIKVIKDKYDKDPDKYSLLAAIVEEEASAGTHKKSYSVTDSILWLGRSILFMTEMFKHIKTEENFSKIVSLAYESTLKQYHNFFVRSMFTMISPAVPSKESVMAALAMTEKDKNKHGYNVCLYDSVAAYNEGLVAVCENIRKLLALYDIVLMKER